MQIQTAFNNGNWLPAPTPPLHLQKSPSILTIATCHMNLHRFYLVQGEVRKSFSQGNELALAQIWSNASYTVTPHISEMQRCTSWIFLQFIYCWAGILISRNITRNHFFLTLGINKTAASERLAQWPNRAQLECHTFGKYFCFWAGFPFLTWKMTLSWQSRIAYICI